MLKPKMILRLVNFLVLTAVYCLCQQSNDLSQTFAAVTSNGPNGTCSSAESLAAIREGISNQVLSHLQTIFQHNPDECVLGTANCSQNCHNTPGSYFCSCNSGYILDVDGITCNAIIDTDECANNFTNDCQQQCTNTQGSYECSCDEGFTLNLDQITCRDVDECVLGSANCSQNCHNTLGSYYCSCDSGYILDVDGITCNGICLTRLYVMAFTSGLSNAGAGASANHGIELQVNNMVQSVVFFNRPGDDYSQNKGDLWDFAISSFGFPSSCIQIGDIQSVAVVAGSSQGWNIADIVTTVKDENGNDQLLASNFGVNQWIETGAEESRRRFELSFS